MLKASHKAAAWHLEPSGAESTARCQHGHHFHLFLRSQAFADLNMRSPAKRAEEEEPEEALKHEIYFRFGNFTGLNGYNVPVTLNRLSSTDLITTTTSRPVKQMVTH